jgi:hypothetical protein
MKSKIAKGEINPRRLIKLKKCIKLALADLGKSDLYSREMFIVLDILKLLKPTEFAVKEQSKNEAILLTSVTQSTETVSVTATVGNKTNESSSTSTEKMDLATELHNLIAFVMVSGPIKNSRVCSAV